MLNLVGAPILCAVWFILLHRQQQFQEPASVTLEIDSRDIQVKGRHDQRQRTGGFASLHGARITKSGRFSPLSLLVLFQNISIYNLNVHFRTYKEGNTALATVGEKWKHMALAQHISVQLWQHKSSWCPENSRVHPVCIQDPSFGRCCFPRTSNWVSCVWHSHSSFENTVRIREQREHLLLQSSYSDPEEKRIQSSLQVLFLKWFLALELRSIREIIGTSNKPLDVPKLIQILGGDLVTYQAVCAN